MVVDSDHLDQHRGWSWRISSADICYSVCWLWLCSLLCYLSVPSLQMSRKLFNYYIWHFYCRRPSLHHVHLLPLFGLYGKYRGLGIFPSIVIDMSETNLVYLSQFLLHDGWFGVNIPGISSDWSGILFVASRYGLYHSGSWNKHIFHIFQDDSDTFIESLKTRFMVLNMRYQNYFFLTSYEGHIFPMIKTLIWK